MGEGGLGDFSKLSTEEQRRFLAASRQMSKLALDQAIPITFAPPLKTLDFPLMGGKMGRVTLPQSLGKVDGATGCVLRLRSGVFIVTAEHVWNMKAALAEVRN
jgi:hypothetical protein